MGWLENVGNTGATRCVDSVVTRCDKHGIVGENTEFLVNVCEIPLQPALWTPYGP